MSKAKFKAQDVQVAMAEFLASAVVTETSTTAPPEVAPHRNGPVRVYALIGDDADGVAQTPVP